MRPARARLRGRARLSLCALLGLLAPSGAARCAITGSAPAILSRLAPAWVADYTARFPDAAIRLRQPFGPPQGQLDPNLQSFLDGQIPFALLSRELADADSAAFRRAHGVDPVIIPIAQGAWHDFGYVDPVVVIVNRANPVASLSLRQLDAIFSTTRLRGGAPIRRWNAAGVARWRGRPIHIVGGDAWAGEASARAQTFRRVVLDVAPRAGRFRRIADSGGEKDAVARVAADPLAIAFTGFGHIGAGVKPLAIRLRRGGAPVPPTEATIRAGRYPLARTIDLLLAPGPNRCVGREEWALAVYLLSDAGQAVVARTAPFAPLPRQLRTAAQRRLRPCA